MSGSHRRGTAPRMSYAQANYLLALREAAARYHAAATAASVEFAGAAHAMTEGTIPSVHLEAVESARVAEGELRVLAAQAPAVFPEWQAAALADLVSAAMRAGDAGWIWAAAGAAVAQPRHQLYSIEGSVEHGTGT